MAEVPIVDLEGGDAARRAAIDAACRDWGFFQIRGHGVDPALARELAREMRDFFAAPEPTKRAVERTAANVWGFYDRELTKNRRDWKEIFDVGPPEASGPLAGSTPQWPEARPAFRRTLETWAATCEEVALRLLDDVAANLDVEPPHLGKAFVPTHTSFLRLNYYPPCPDPAPPDADFVPERGALGISHHTDAGALTVLLQDDVPGLQVLHAGRWRIVPPIEDALVVNVGDVVQVWSNDRYRAPLHRVLANAERARYSAAYFFNPSYETDYAPRGDAPRDRPINWGEFRAARSAGDYADQGQEVQIGDFRIESGRRDGRT